MEKEEKEEKEEKKACCHTSVGNDDDSVGVCGVKVRRSWQRTLGWRQWWCRW